MFNLQVIIQAQKNVQDNLPLFNFSKVQLLFWLILSSSCIPLEEKENNDKCTNEYRTEWVYKEEKNLEKMCEQKLVRKCAMEKRSNCEDRCKKKVRVAIKKLRNFTYGQSF